MAIQDAIDLAKPALQSRGLETLFWLVDNLAWPGIQAGAVESAFGIFFPFLYKFREEGTQKVVTIVLAKTRGRADSFSRERLGNRRRRHLWPDRQHHTRHYHKLAASKHRRVRTVVNWGLSPGIDTFQGVQRLTNSRPDSASLTVLTVDQDGHHKGDVDLALPTDLAGRIQELLARTTGNDCADASLLHIPTSRVRQRTQGDPKYYQELLCRVEDVVVNARSTGPLVALGGAANRQTQLIWRDPYVQAVQLIAQDRARRNMQTLHFTADALKLSALVGIAVATVVAFLAAAIEDTTLAAHNFISEAKVFFDSHSQTETCTASTTVGIPTQACFDVYSSTRVPLSNTKC